jgi:hypothetical protein
MHFFTINKRPFDMAVQRSQHPDASMHHEVATFGGADKATDGGLPFLKVLIGLRRLHDVVGGIAQSQPLAPAR